MCTQPPSHSSATPQPPPAAAHLAVVPPQHCQAGAGVGAVDVHRVVVDCRKVLPPIAEAGVPAGLDGQLLDNAQVICTAGTPGTS